ncbi:neutral zinc metallopeptidase [Nonomuraea sp. SBT364]|uniref:neutral zinc metallopeptidase n=1 Tax=Nonomuraea sp. SBT364 TaxID=1580530 RepID=UPI001E46E8EF|nr:neutral zinc metallopeptidase [Nonomuraea sp. SBT364]
MRLLLTLPLLAGLAVPAPYEDPLAATGKLATAACPEPAIVQGGIPRTREYLTAMMKCLDRSWSRHFAGAGLTFRKPVVRYYDEPATRVCGGDWPDGAAAFYCTERATLVFPLTGRWIEDRTDLYPLKVAAHEYGHHVQSLTGIRKHYESGARASRARQAELGRRYELQADCLSGVFLGSVWGSLARGRGDWEAVLDATRASGDDDGERRSHGKGANRAYWLKRGFTAQRPGACDTWSAPAARVA